MSVDRELRAALHADFFVELRDDRGDPGSSDVQRLDALLDSLDLLPLETGWQLIDLSQAKALLDDVLGETLGGGVPVVHRLPPDRILAGFLASFDTRRARFYTNVTAWRGGDASSWTPFTRGGRCVCVACCDDRQAGMLWTDQ